MIQDCTCVRHFARPPCLPHQPEDSRIALCLSFLRTLHTNRMSGLKIIHTTKRNEGEAEQQEGSRRLGLGHASSRSLCHAGAGWWQKRRSRLAFDLCKAPGVWVCHFKVFFHTQWSPKEPLAPRGEMKRVKETEAKSQSAVRQDPVILAVLPRGQLKTGQSREILLAFQVQVPSGYTVENVLQSIRLILLSLGLRQKETGWRR